MLKLFPLAPSDLLQCLLEAVLLMEALASLSVSDFTKHTILVLFILPASQSFLHFLGLGLSVQPTLSLGAAIRVCVFSCLSFLLCVAFFLLL